MQFPLGKPILVMVGLSVVSGALILLRPTPPAKDQSLWVFADSHAREYRALRAGYEGLSILRRLDPDLRRILGPSHADFKTRADRIEREALPLARNANLDHDRLSGLNVGADAIFRMAEILLDRWVEVNAAAGTIAVTNDPKASWLAGLREANWKAESALRSLLNGDQVTLREAAPVPDVPDVPETLPDHATAALRLGAMTVAAAEGPWTAEQKQALAGCLAEARAGMAASLSAARASLREGETFAPQLPNRYRRSLAVNLIPPRALDVRMVGLFLSGEGAGESPDAVEVGMDSVGRYFKPPVSEVGFLPLNAYLENAGFREIDSPDAPGREGWNARSLTDGKVYTHDGHAWRLNPDRDKPDAWMDRVVRARFAPWSKEGVIFGVPHDIHPVTLTYRADLFTEAGIDLEAPDAGRDYLSWSEFHRRCLRFQAYWAPRGVKGRYAMDLFETNADVLAAMLLQRGVNVIDDYNRVHLTDPKVAETVAFYARLVAGEERIGVESSSAGQGAWTRDLYAGNVCAFVTPDWRVSSVRQYAGDLTGKLRMMPLPRFDPEDAPTSTWSGTMIGIPRSCKDPDDAWKLIEYLYLGDAALDARVRDVGIIPPVKDHWDSAVYRQPDPLYGGQPTRALYAKLAGQIPRQYVTAYTPFGRYALAYALGAATRHLKAGGDPAHVQPLAREQLRAAQAELEWRIRFAAFPAEGGRP